MEKPVAILGGGACAAAIMTGKDKEKIARLPDITGMKNEFLTRRVCAYHYDWRIRSRG